MIKIMIEYTDYIDVFFSDIAIKLPKNIIINYYIIKLVENKQSIYRLIYCLGIIKYKTPKTYINTNL